THALAFAPDGKTLALANADGCIMLWDVATGKWQASSPEPNGPLDIRFANNGKEILILGDGVEWWDLTSAKPTRRIAKDPTWHSPQTVSLDGKLLAARLLTGDLALIDATTGDHLRTFAGHKGTYQTTP